MVMMSATVILGEKGWLHLRAIAPMPAQTRARLHDLQTPSAFKTADAVRQIHEWSPMSGEDNHHLDLSHVKVTQPAGQTQRAD